MKRVLSIVLSAVMLLSCFSVASVTYAMGGNGIESNPYTISTASELQNINNNVSASYKLVADIDLSGMDFTPIGNADSGAFSGTFDGNGYTISNLNVQAGKYAGLFGCNEGTIKNVKLSNISIYGTKYIGGIVGNNTSFGTVNNCVVFSGSINAEEAISTLYVGGIIGSDNGNFSNCSNFADIVSRVNNGDIGGIVGYTKSPIIENCYNYGDIKVSDKAYDDDNFAYVGGIAATAIETTIVNCKNSGNLIGSVYSAYCGGISAYTSASTIKKCQNSGLVNVVGSGASGGWYGRASTSRSGGIVAYDESCSIELCENTGNVHSYGYYSTSGGIVGSGSGSITKCIFVGCAYETHHYQGSASVSPYGDSQKFDCYNGKNIVATTNKVLSIPDNIVEEYGSLLDNNWTISNSYNGNVPALAELNEELSINYSNYCITRGDTIKLAVYKNGQDVSNAVEWSSTENTVIVDKNGNVSINSNYTGSLTPVTITAKDSQGYRANCNIYCYEPATSLNFNTKKIYTYENDVTCSLTTMPDTDIIMYYSSSDESIFTVTYDGVISPKSLGTAQIIAHCLSGKVLSSDIIVTDELKSLSWSSSTSIERGATRQMDSNKGITFSSSNDNIVSVDQNGYFTGVNIGKAVITGKTANGLEANCEVTVYAPAKSINVDRKEITLYKGLTDYITATTNPVDSTDSITYSTSSSSVCSVNSSTGLITANRTGTARITATASSGVSSVCYVTVVDAPIVVTDLSLSDSTYTIEKGEAFALTATITPSDATNKKITWSTSNSVVATVNNSGVITAVDNGTATITATTSNGIERTCEVTVVDAINIGESCEHNWVAQTVLPATCLNAGKEVYECSLCGKKKTIILEILEHTFVEEKYAATPNAQGYTKYTCPVCNYAYVCDITPYTSDSSTLDAVIEEANYYSKSKFSAEQIQSIIDEAESHRALAKTNAPQAEYDYAVGEILTAIYEVDELATYTPVGIEGDVVTLENELGEEREVSFEEAINEYEAPLDVVMDGIINAKDFAYLIKNYSE